MVRCTRTWCASRRAWCEPSVEPTVGLDVGLEICPDTPFDERQIVQMYVDHLRDDESWAI